MGLLDQTAMNSPEMGMAMGLLSAGGASRMPVSLGQGLAQGYQGYQQAAQAEQMRQMHDMQIQQQKAHVEEMQRQKAALQQFRAQLPPPLQAQFDMDPKGFISYMRKQEEEYTLTPGAVRFRGKEKLAEAPMEVKPQTELEKLMAARDRYPVGDPNRKFYDAAISKATTHAPPVSVSYGSPMAGEDEKGNKVFFQPDKKGGAPAIIKGVKPSGEVGKAPTEGETKAAFYAGNMRAATKVLDQLEAQGVDMSKLGSQVDTSMAGGITNIVASQTAQKARQAQEQWAEQNLRMQTGAAATKDEIIRNIRTYFPQPGDGPEVVAQKKAMRLQAENGVFAAAGRAQGRVHGSGGVKFLGFE